MVSRLRYMKGRPAPEVAAWAADPPSSGTVAPSAAAAIAEAFLATDLVDVTMLIAHHFPELRCEARTWPRGQAPRWSGSYGPPGSWESAWPPGVQFWLHLRATRR